VNSLSVFLSTRYRPASSRDKIAASHASGFRRLRRDIMPKSPLYATYADRPFTEWPIMNKARMMENFTAINTVGLTREAALETAIQAENSRDFSPMVQGVAVGLSTGTSGQRGLFASNRKERALWAALMTGRFLPSLMRRQRVAFFLRANNQLYESLNNPLIQFGFYDLLEQFDNHLPRLQDQNPTVLIAPAQILGLLAKAKIDSAIDLRPQVVISVAEVASPEDAALIERAFGRRLDQVYQCTEGVLGMTCRHGNLHLNESFLHIEREVIDATTGAFVPIITDLARETLPILRYRLDDVLVPDPTPCPCGCASLRLTRIEGRCDDILHWTTPQGTLRMIPSDAIRQAVAGVSVKLRDYRAEQYGPDRLVLSLDGDDFPAARSAILDALTAQAVKYGALLPSVSFRNGITVNADRKRRLVINCPPHSFHTEKGLS